MSCLSDTPPFVWRLGDRLLGGDIRDEPGKWRL